MNTVRKFFCWLRRYLGVFLYDLPFIVLTAMRPSKPDVGIYPWIWLHNRGEELLYARNEKGVRCNWKTGSDLYVTKILPICGRLLYRKALRDFPIRLTQEPENLGPKQPEVSFIIGHRGMERLAILLATLQSIAGQKNCSIECIVVEHDVDVLVKSFLPSWVKYRHIPLTGENKAFSKSKTFNTGARVAKSNIIILHDGDMLVPEAYADEVLRCHEKGYDFVSLKRFIFYLSQISSQALINKRSVAVYPEIEAISQNLRGGGSCAISRSAYFEIGGFDERFAGWGGEDIEFLDRAKTLKIYPYEYLPIIHLWHTAQKGKWTVKAPGFSTYNKLAKISVPERIQYLRKQFQGDDVYRK